EGYAEAKAGARTRSPRATKARTRAGQKTGATKEAGRTSPAEERRATARSGAASRRSEFRAGEPRTRETSGWRENVTAGSVAREPSATREERTKSTGPDSTIQSGEKRAAQSRTTTEDRSTRPTRAIRIKGRAEPRGPVIKTGWAEKAIGVGQRKE